MQASFRKKGTKARGLIEHLEQRTLLSANLLTNGDFESEPNIADSVQGYGVNGNDPGFSLLVGSQIPAWTIASGHGVTVHIASANEYPVITGGFGVNTDGEGYNSHNADFYQDFPSENGTAYNLTFDWQGWFSSSSQLDVSLTDTTTSTVLSDNLYSWDSALHHESVPFTGNGDSIRLEIKENPETGVNDDGFNVDNFSVTTGGANLLIRPQPTNTPPGDPINKGTGVRVAILNDQGITDTTASDTFTASLVSTNNATGTLSGTLSQATSGGAAVFNDLSVDKPGQYELNFTDTEGDTIASNSFTVSDGKLVFVHKIKDGQPAKSLTPTVTVELVDKKGHRITTASSSVTLGISAGILTNPITGKTAQLVKGLAKFPGLQLAQPGDYTLTASDDEGDATGDSNSFKVTGYHLAFKKEPGTIGVNKPLQYKIAVEDTRNRLVNISTIGLGLQLNTIVPGGDNPTVSPSADTVDFGYAVNSGSTPSKINAAGTYTITFTPISESSDSFDYTIPAITSGEFKVMDNRLIFRHQPAGRIINSPLRYTVAMVDYRNHIVNNNTDHLQYTLLPAGSGATLASATQTLIGGLDDNNSSLMAIDKPGTYQLVVVDQPADPSDAPASSATSEPFKIK